MNDEQETNHAFARSHSNAGLERIPCKHGYFSPRICEICEAVQAEREACARICDAQHFQGKHDNNLIWTGCAAHLADAIRTRSNVKVRGCAPGEIKKE